MVYTSAGFSSLSQEGIIMRWLVMAVLGLGLLLLPLRTEAQEKPRDAEAMFKELDENKDGKLSLEEFKKAKLPRLADKPEFLERVFSRIDTDGDKYLSLEEFKRFADRKPKPRPRPEP